MCKKRVPIYILYSYPLFAHFFIKTPIEGPVGPIILVNLFHLKLGDKNPSFHTTEFLFAKIGQKKCEISRFLSNLV